MKLRNLTAPLLVGLVAGLAGAAVVLLFSPKEHSGYVRLAEVYQEFTLRKDYDQRLRDLGAARQTAMDSLAHRAERLASNGQAALADSARAAFLALRQFSLEESQVNAQQYEQLVWQKLNTYLRDFGQTQGYTILYGADGSGTLMYADTALDATAAAVEYVNQRHAADLQSNPPAMPQ